MKLQIILSIIIPLLLLTFLLIQQKEISTLRNNLIYVEYDLNRSLSRLSEDETLLSRMDNYLESIDHYITQLIRSHNLGKNDKRFQSLY